MVMELLGLSLEDLFNKCRRRFSLKTVLKIGDQMLERIETLHSRHLIHRDIKTNNFVIGVGQKASVVYCVDFGMSKRFRDPKTLQHTPYCDWKSLSGTPRYASINNHLGIRPTRRDDLEAIAYILIYFLKGSLPWQGLKAKTEKEKYKLILRKKQETTISELCHGCPIQFADFIAYTRSLKFDEGPDIPRWRRIFQDLYRASNCDAVPREWDWDGMDVGHKAPPSSSSAAALAAPMAALPVAPRQQQPVMRVENNLHIPPPPPGGGVMNTRDFMNASTTVDRTTPNPTDNNDAMSIGAGDYYEEPVVAVPPQQHFNMVAPPPRPPQQHHQPTYPPQMPSGVGLHHLHHQQQQQLQLQQQQQQLQNGGSRNNMMNPPTHNYPPPPPQHRR
jgi:serine/threonine protein kinase